MTVLQFKRIHISKLALLFLGLGICVFAWGLRYKLSLYRPPYSVARILPKAKLLSQNERSLIDAGGSASLPPNLPAAKLPRESGLLFAMPVVPGLAVSTGAHELAGGAPPGESMIERAALKTFSFRPPPPAA